MTVNLGSLPTVGGDTGVWGSELNTLLTNLVAQLSNLDNTSDVNKPLSTAASTAFAARAPIASPAFTGVPTAPTPSAGTNSTQLATTAFVTSAVAAGGGGGGSVSDATTTSKGVIQLAGDLTGTAAAPALAGVISGGTVGSSSAVPVITYDSKGRITAVSTAAVAGSTGTSPDSVSLAAYSPVADGLWGLTGSMTAAGTTLTFTTGGLVSATHVGATVRVAGAGASGAVLVTTISSVTNATTAVLAAAASTTVSNAMTLIGHNNATAITNAMTAATGKVLTFPKGVYYVGTNLQIPTGTTLDLSGATLLYGGFTPGTLTKIRNGYFVGDAGGAYGAAIFMPDSAISDFDIVDNRFYYHSWGILAHANSTQMYYTRGRFRGNRFDRMQLGCTYMGQMLDCEFAWNISTNIKAGANTFNFQGTQQRNDIHHNTVNGGRAGIIFLWNYGSVPAPTATQTWESYGNRVHHNRVIGQTEEGISCDATYATFDNATVSAVNTSAKTITLAASAWATAGSVWQYSYVGFLTGTNASRIYRIQAQSNATLTLEMDATDIAAVTVGDTLVIGAPFHHNVIDHNYVDGRLSSTYSIWLYAFGAYNVVEGNTVEGATIGTASANSLATVSGSVTGGLTSSPVGYNIFANNAVSGFSTATATYSNPPGLELQYVQYGGTTDFYTYGNVVTGNVLAGGAITAQRQQKLTANNIARGGAAYTLTPSTSPLSFV